MRLRSLTAAVACFAVVGPAAVAHAVPDLPLRPKPVAHNPADRMLSVPIEDSVYDPATKCSKKPRKGTTELVAWLDANAMGESWGTYRCEKWGPRSASLHAEGRAIDWHLDVRDPVQRKAGNELIRLLLAPDEAGNPQALARRMGVEELIWDCGYWGAGMTEFRKYSECFGKRGKRRRHVNPTAGHLDHIHIGITKAGAAAKTSFWTER